MPKCKNTTSLIIYCAHAGTFSSFRCDHDFRHIPSPIVFILALSLVDSSHLDAPHMKYAPLYDAYRKKNLRHGMKMHPNARIVDTYEEKRFEIT